MQSPAIEVSKTDLKTNDARTKSDWFLCFKKEKKTIFKSGFTLFKKKKKKKIFQLVGWGEKDLDILGQNPCRVMGSEWPSPQIVLGGPP